MKRLCLLIAVCFLFLALLFSCSLKGPETLIHDENTENKEGEVIRGLDQDEDEEGLDAGIKKGTERGGIGHEDGADEGCNGAQKDENRQVRPVDLQERGGVLVLCCPEVRWPNGDSGEISQKSGEGRLGGVSQAGLGVCGVGFIFIGGFVAGIALDVDVVVFLWALGLRRRLLGGIRFLGGIR